MQASQSLTVTSQQNTALTFSAEQRELIKNTVAKGATDNELALFLHLAQSYGLDPFAKEIWCIKYRTTDAATIMTSRDGYLKIANLSPVMDSLVSDTVCEQDEVEKQVDGSVIVRYGRPRGAVIGAYALVYRTDRSRPVYAYAPLSEYKGTSPIWSKYPSAMILKVAESMALKRAFSISGLVTQEEIDMQGPAEAGTSATVVEEEKQAVASIEYATPHQLDEICGLLNHPTVTVQERTKMLLNINRLDTERAAQAIVKLRQAIEDRSAEGAEPDTEYTVMASAEVIEPVAEQPAPKAKKEPLSTEKMEELVKLLNHPDVSGKHKRNTMLALPKMDDERADKEIIKVKAMIVDAQAKAQRQPAPLSQDEQDAGEAEQKAAILALYDFVIEHDNVLAIEDYRRFTSLLDSNADKLVPTKKLQAALAEAQALVAKKSQPAEAPTAAPASETPAPSAGPEPSSTPAPSQEEAREAKLKQIIQLLTSHHVTEGERSKMLLNLNKLSLERAEESIAKLDLTIARRAFCAYANEHAAVIGEAEHQRAMKRCESLTAAAFEFEEELDWLKDFVQSKGKQAA